LKPEVLKIGERALKKAAEVIKKGGVVVYPTETFYGIGADATNERAVKKVFQIKKRAEHMPILLIIGNEEMLSSVVKEVPESAFKLIRRFWPGPLTIIFRAKEDVIPALHSSTGKIGVRLSGNYTARQLSILSGVPITGTSANISGSLPCKTAQEVMDQLHGVDLILDAGVVYSELATTVVDVTEKPFKIIRKGVVSEEEISRCLGEGIHA
jgi:L-threonylcarbamoyladenylate synthase